MLLVDIYLILGIIVLITNLISTITLLRIALLILSIDTQRRLWISSALILFLSAIIVETFIIMSYMVTDILYGYASLLFPKYSLIWCATYLLFMLSAVLFSAHTFTSLLAITVFLQYSLAFLAGIMFMVALIGAIKKRMSRILALSMGGIAYCFLSGLGFMLGDQLLVFVAIVLRDLIVIGYMRY